MSVLKNNVAKFKILGVEVLPESYEWYESIIHMTASFICQNVAYNAQY